VVQHTVLVVDDDQDIREALELLLLAEGYGVRTAPDGAQAVAMMEAEAPCFVILDLMMPVMDGWEVAGRMHDDPRLDSIPVCVVTATPEWAPSDSVCVIPKPIDVQKLLDVVQSYCLHTHAELSAP
jgi:CheY-like chemotaxis protein